MASLAENELASYETAAKNGQLGNIVVFDNVDITLGTRHKG